MVTFFFKNDRFRLVGRVHFLDIILYDHGAFIKHGPLPASFYFRPFHTQINILIGNSVDIVLGIRTQDYSMVGADGSTERPPYNAFIMLASGGNTFMHHSILRDSSQEGT